MGKAETRQNNAGRSGLPDSDTDPVDYHRNKRRANQRMRVERVDLAMSKGARSVAFNTYSDEWQKQHKSMNCGAATKAQIGSVGASGLTIVPRAK